MSSWHFLPSSLTTATLPPLLTSTVFTPDPPAYTIHLTDLTCLWTETLDRRQIFRRALQDETSIDPSEDKQNARLFISYLKSAFDPVSSQQDSPSTISLSPSKDGNHLALRITCVLPANLAPLEWKMHLTCSSPGAVATHLILPLIHAQRARRKEAETLMDVLREKDAVITKLVDKLEAHGTGLEQVFITALSSKRKVSRATAEEKVKGLRPFSKEGFDVKTEGGVSVERLLEDVFGSEGVGFDQEEVLQSSDEWWRRAGDTPIERTGARSFKQKRLEVTKAEKHPTPKRDEGDEDDDEFQVQATPAHLETSTVQGPSIASRVGATDGKEEDDDLIPDSNNANDRSPAQPPTSNKPSKLGSIGGKPKNPPTRQSTPEPATEYQADDSATASEDESELAAPPQPTKQSAEPSAKHNPEQSDKPSSRLGRIGGNSGTSNKVQTKAKSSSTLSPPPEVNTSPRKAKLGHIGAKTDEIEIDMPSRGRSPVKASVVEERPRQTSEERADEKRAELEKELARKVAAGPAKKKRKF